MTTERALELFNRAIDTHLRDEDLPYISDETRESINIIEKTGTLYEQMGGTELSRQVVALCIVMGERINELREAHDNHLHG